MARRSKVDALPTEILDEFNARLVASGFSGYEGFSEWLKSMGYNISKSALHRHGSALEAEFEEAMADARRTRALARAARESGDENDDAMLSAASSIMQDNLLRVSLKLKNSGNDPAETAKTLSLISRAFADVGRFDISRQKWKTEMEAKIRAEERALAAEQATTAAKAGGASPETITKIRVALGIEG